MMCCSTCTQVSTVYPYPLELASSLGQNVCLYHDCRFSVDLRNRGITISNDMKQSLMLLHSYVLVKVSHTHTHIHTHTHTHTHTHMHASVTYFFIFSNLAQVHVKRGEHVMAARLLIRVANNISKFPSRELV